jgi:hypothetical protein
MSLIRSTLALVAIACTEPTAVSHDATMPVARQEAAAASSYSIGGAGQTVYVRLASPRETVEPAHAFMRRMFASADSAGARRMVIDLRGVTGGDARIIVPLIRGIVTRERFARSGGLYVVVGEQSFAPSQSAATLLSRFAQPRFVSDVPAI